jgi:hypothetical protein
LATNVTLLALSNHRLSIAIPPNRQWWIFSISVSARSLVADMTDPSRYGSAFAKRGTKMPG